MKENFEKDGFKKDLCYALAEAYTLATLKKEKTPFGFSISMFERYKEAFNKGAVFFGPLAVWRTGDYTWIIRDLRGGWGYNPIDAEMHLEKDETPTLDKVLDAIQNHKSRLQNACKACEFIIEEMNN